MQRLKRFKWITTPLGKPAAVEGKAFILSQGLGGGLRILLARVKPLHDTLNLRHGEIRSSGEEKKMDSLCLVAVNSQGHEPEPC